MSNDPFAYPRTTATISINASREYQHLLKILSAKRSVRIADLVRDAIDAAYSEELHEIATFVSTNNHKR